MPVQPRWRYCGQCQSLFYNGIRDDRGNCPQGQGQAHAAVGYDFHLTHDESVGGGFIPTQTHWYMCGYCKALFDGNAPYNGQNDDKPVYGQGVCPGTTLGHFRDQHAGTPPDFVLVYGMPASPESDSQNGWRHCLKCQVLYYDGYPGKGACAASGEHDGRGWDPAVRNFVLFYPLTPLTVLTRSGFDIGVQGGGFTPESEVNCTYGVNRGEDASVVVGEQQVRTDHEGVFRTQFTAPLGWVFANVVTWDIATGRNAQATINAQ